ncbi:hypothetical protein BZA77DRAFT_295261 [Pyronema omphalodes]|nr:hypothetical protein BZA77DRAFT_295261 [Pyronema omphalodes]
MSLTTTTNNDHTILTTHDSKRILSLTKNATLYRTTGSRTIEQLLLLELHRIQALRKNLRLHLPVPDNRGAVGYVNDREILQARESAVMELLYTGVLKGLFTSFLIYVSAVRSRSEENVKAVMKLRKAIAARKEKETLETIWIEKLAQEKVEDTYNRLQNKIMQCEFEGKQPVLEFLGERRLGFSNVFKTEVLDMLDEYERKATCYRILDEDESV